ncbi:hypothetical protein [Verminephrobacter eiseniae]|uniref:hypothetical protein n=1 Tax=Verminephrobacter eiseniae TaxID=364317 RepID=UPI002238B93F|nr:hypothetical protein [Verminephrobacter eiseniae]
MKQDHEPRDAIDLPGNEKPTPEDGALFSSPGPSSTVLQTAGSKGGDGFALSLVR